MMTFMMRKLLFVAILCCVSLRLIAQDSLVFKGYLYNDEYKVYLDIDFYNNHVVVPGQEILGEMSGFFGALRDSRKWLITSVDVCDSHTAKLSITNDFGSEDLEATLTQQKDGSYILHQGKGSRIKIVVDRKWVKIPSDLVLFKRYNKGKVTQ